MYLWGVLRLKGVPWVFRGEIGCGAEGGVSSGKAFGGGHGGIKDEELWG